jgi:hypothetical protein
MGTSDKTTAIEQSAVSHNILFAKRIEGLVNAAPVGMPCYALCMTKLLDEAIHRLRQLPEPMQDTAARAVIRQLEEEPEHGDPEAIAAGRIDFEHGEFVTLDQLRHEMGAADR